MAPTAPNTPSILHPVLASNDGLQGVDQSLGGAAAQDPDRLHCTLAPDFSITLAHLSMSRRR